MRQGKNVTRAVLQPEADRLSKYTQVVERIHDIYDMDYRALGYERSTEENAVSVMQVFDTLGEEFLRSKAVKIAGGGLSHMCHQPPLALAADAQASIGRKSCEDNNNRCLLVHKSCILIC